MRRRGEASGITAFSSMGRRLLEMVLVRRRKDRAETRASSGAFSSEAIARLSPSGDDPDRSNQEELAGYWIVGLPVTYVLCFTYGWGVTGIWVGLTSALILIGLLLLAAWHREMKVA